MHAGACAHLLACAHVTAHCYMHAWSRKLVPPVSSCAWMGKDQLCTFARDGKRCMLDKWSEILEIGAAQFSEIQSTSAHIARPCWPSALCHAGVPEVRILLQKLRLCGRCRPPRVVCVHLRDNIQQQRQDRHCPCEVLCQAQHCSSSSPMLRNSILHC